MAVSLSYREFVALNPCAGKHDDAVKKLGGARKWRAKRVTAAEAKSAGIPFQDVVWTVNGMARSNDDVERRLRLWLADCAAHVLHIFERTSESPEPRYAITVGRHAARTANWRAKADAQYWLAISAANNCRSRPGALVVRVAAHVLASKDDVAFLNAASLASEAYATDATLPWDSLGWLSNRTMETAWQFDRLVDWMSDCEPADWPLPAAKHAA